MNKKPQQTEHILLGNEDFGAAIFRELSFQMSEMDKNEFYWMCLVNSFGKQLLSAGWPGCAKESSPGSSDLLEVLALRKKTSGETFLPTQSLLKVPL